MIDSRHVFRCALQIFKSVRFILHALSLDYISSSVHVKNLPPTAPQEDAWPRCRSERLPLNIHKTVMTTRAVSPFRVAQKAALTPLYGGNCYIQQMSQLYYYRRTLRCLIIGTFHSLRFTAAHLTHWDGNHNGNYGYRPYIITDADAAEKCGLFQMIVS